MLNDSYLSPSRILADAFGKELEPSRAHAIAERSEAILRENVVLTGVRKMCVLTMIKYHQITHHLLEEVVLHPES